MKKEITIAALSAVALIVFLGSTSYLLFPQVSVQAYTAKTDVYTQKGGEGSGKPSGNFTQGETVHFYAEVRNASNTPLGSRLVSFEILGPDNSVKGLRTGTTNSSGIAEIIFTVPQDPSSIGKWVVYTTVSVEDQLLVDALTFWVQ